MLYQTLEDRNNPDAIEQDGPFKCRRDTSWLGDGYYFWDSFIELAHFWGKNSGYSDYIICSAEADLNENNCYDLFGNINHILDFKNIVQLLEKEGVIDNKTTVKRIITYMKSKGLFQHNAIKVAGVNSISNQEENDQYTLRFNFIDHKKSDVYLDLIPPIQVCIFNCNKVSLKNYKIIYPDIYVEGFVI